MRPALPLIVAVGILLYGFLGDGVVNALFEQAVAGGGADRLVFLVAAIARLGGIAGLAALGWLLLRGPRHVLAMGAMVVIGLYFAFAPALVVAVIPGAGVDALPLAVEAYQITPGLLLLWMSAGVAVLGGIGLFWPSEEPPPEPSEPEAAGPAAD